MATSASNVKTLHCAIYAARAPAPHRLGNFNLLIHQFLVVLVASGELERIGQHSFTLLYTRNHIRTSEPVCFREIGLRPLSRMVGMRVVKPDDVLAALAALPLDAD